jgi:hypothetical protein
LVLEVQLTFVDGVLHAAGVLLRIDHLPQTISKLSKGRIGNRQHGQACDDQQSSRRDSHAYGSPS